MRIFWFCLLSALTPLFAAEHINILVYHHVSEQTPASTSVSPEQFRSHLQLLRDENFTVMPLDRAIEKLQQRQPLPENAVAITFDDGYRNIYENALPLLEEFGFPFTLFVATDAIDSGRANMLSWDQLRDMQSRGVIIANHSRDHGYLVRYPLRNSEWRKQIRQNITHAQQRLEAELVQQPPKWLAYPYGEFSNELKDLLQKENYIGFAQHSGGVDAQSDFMALPRFAAAGIYANPATLLTKLRSRPMPVDHSLQSDMLTTNSMPELTAVLRHKKDVNSSLNCFIDGSLVSAIWNDELSFSVRTDQSLSTGRHRYNCTAHSKTGSFYYWYSKPWLVYLQSK